MKNKMEPFRMTNADTVKNSAYGVTHSTHKKHKRGRIPTDALNERIKGNNDNPAHQNVIDNAKDAELL